MREWPVVSEQWSLRNKKNIFFRLTFHLVILTLSAVYFAGCAARQEVKPSKTLPAAVEIIRHIEEGRGKVYSLKGMASIKGTYNGKDSNFKEVLVVKRPSKIRAETVGLFGNPVFTLALDGPVLSTYKPAENIFYKGSISSHEILLPFPLDEVGSEELANILLGGISLIEYANSDIEFSEAENSYIVTLRSPDGFKKQVITTDTRDLRLKKSEIIDGERGMTLSATFDIYQDIGSLSFPKEITIQFVSRPDTIQINYEDIELNTDLPDELFVLTPP
jgi:outer membrane lipoprotein-sorting protein